MIVQNYISAFFNIGTCMWVIIIHSLTYKYNTHTNTNTNTCASIHAERPTRTHARTHTHTHTLSLSYADLLRYWSNEESTVLGGPVWRYQRQYTSHIDIFDGPFSRDAFGKARTACWWRLIRVERCVGVWLYVCMFAVRMYICWQSGYSCTLCVWVYICVCVCMRVYICSCFQQSGCISMTIHVFTFRATIRQCTSR